MTYRITINGYNLDLSPDTVISISASLNDLAELRDRQISYTNGFTIPLTQNNRNLLGISGLVTDESATPYESLVATVFKDGIPVIFRGVAIIQEYTPTSARIAVYDAALGFFEAIEGKKLHDLDLSSLTHDWTLANVVGSIANTSGYIYPLAQHGAQSFVLNNFDVRYLHPAIYAHTVAEQIATEAGYTLGGDFIASDWWTKTVLPFSKKEYKNGKDFVEDKSFAYRLRTQQIVSETVTTDGADEPLVDINLAPGDTYTASESITFNEINARIEVSNLQIIKSNPGAAVSLRFVLRKNGLIDLDQQLFTADGTYTLTASSVSLLAGETLSFELMYVFAWGGPDPQDARISMNLSSGILYSEQPEDTIQFGGEVRASAILPNLGQKEYLKALAQMFGLIFQVDTQNKVLYLRQFAEIAGNIPSAIDWSDKLAQTYGDPYEGIETQISSAYGQESWFRYAEDERVRDEYGDAFLQVEDRQLKPRRDVVSLPWAASQHTEIGTSGFSVAEIDYYRSDGAGGWEVEGAPTQRFCYLVDDATLVNYTDGTATSSDTCKLLRFTGTGDALDLHFQALLSNHYTELANVLRKAKMVSAKFNLNATDIANLDFFTPVFVQQYGAYFYINAVRDYIAGQVTEVELVRL